jgi:hypothetical protein
VVDVHGGPLQRSVQVRIHTFTGGGTPNQLNGHYLGYLYHQDKGTILANVHIHIRLP